MIHSSRRDFLLTSAALAAGSMVFQTARADEVAALQWADVRDWGVEGRGFSDTEAWFDRLPSRAKGIVQDAVWALSRHSAGMMVRFQTDATEIHVDYGVTSSNLAMPHMPATGVSGLDLYASDTDGIWKWVAVVAPTTQQTKKSVISGRMESTVGQFLVELDAAAYVIDCLPNMSAEEVTARTIPLVNQIRTAHPKTPIVLVEDRSYAGSWLIVSQKKRNESSRLALKTEYQKLLDSGMQGLSYVDGESLLGADRDDTTDGSHPSDLGFQRHADAFEPVLRTALAK